VHKLLTLQSDYSKNGSCIQLALPIFTETLIPVDDSVRLIDQVLEEINYRELYLTYSSEGRNPAVSPKTLFKIMVYAYSQHIYSSREIEKACKLNLAFIYLLKGEKAPDHSTIARFRREHLTSCVEGLLTQLVKLLAEADEIHFENLFIDGTKIEANANKYTFVWKGFIEKSEAKLQEKATKYLMKELGFTKLPEYISAEYLQKVLSDLVLIADHQDTKFVYGSGKRKTDIQRQIETIEDFKTRQDKYEEARSTFKGRNSYSKTDKDATFMHMKEDYMRNGQLKPGYNIQAAVESEYIVGIDVSAERSDTRTLIPFLEKLEANYGRRFDNLIADAGYESEENYDYLNRKDITPYIKPSNYEYSKTRKFQKEMEFRLAMKYDETKDEYTCKGGRNLSFVSTQTKKGFSGYTSIAKIYRCESCEGCPYYGKCYKGNYSKKIQVSERFDYFREESRKNIVSEKGIQLRINRSIQAEGVFGITKQDYGFKRFLMRGAENVRTEYLILAIAFDLNKLHYRIQSNRIGLSLFPLPESA
jgi:transposase